MSDFRAAQPDVSGKRPASLADIRTLLMDMDGVIYFEEEVLPGIQEFLGFLRQERIRFAFLTNGTNRSPEDHRAYLAACGIAIDEAPILTAGLAAVDYLRQRGPGTRVYVVGGEGFRRQLVERGGCLLDDQSPDFVVVGWTPDFDYQMLAKACRAIWRGARLLVADPDVNDPSPEGPTPGSGAFAAAIEAATGTKGLIIGKPNRILFRWALENLGADPGTSAMLGDRLESDVQGGLRAGLRTILILTGIANRQMVANSPWKPDWIVRDLIELRDRWRAALHGRPEGGD